MPDSPLPLLHVFEVPGDDGRIRHLLAFIEPARADSIGIDSESIVGEITPTAEGGFDPQSLQRNPQFLQAFARYMDEVEAHSPEMVDKARGLHSGWAYVIDPRAPAQPGVEPDQADIVGAFSVDDSGRIVPDSFQYNESHLLIDREKGFSGLFTDQKFYDWLHREPGKA